MKDLKKELLEELTAQEQENVKGGSTEGIIDVLQTRLIFLIKVISLYSIMTFIF